MFSFRETILRSFVCFPLVRTINFILCNDHIDLSGAPCLDIHIESESTQEEIENGMLWKRLCHYNDLKYMMTLSTPGIDTYSEGEKNGNISDISDKGLVPGHSYSVIRTYSTLDGTRLVQLRNPWWDNLNNFVLS